MKKSERGLFIFVRSVKALDFSYKSSKSADFT